MVDNNLAAPCGMYCGACRSYLVKKKNLLAEKGLKKGCLGCRIRNKNCTFIKRDCPLIRKNELEFCYECDKFPCANLKKIDNNYLSRYNVSLIRNLKRIQEIGFELWLKEQKELYNCPNCGAEICIHDAECYDCGLKINPNKI
ncbi:MAG: DUF3795 domain-containing protein [Candidatus Thorarchaeota archaeon]